MSQTNFDMDSLYEALKGNLFSCNGDIGSGVVENDSGNIVILDLNNDEYTISQIINEIPSEGIVDLLTTDNQQIRIQFFKPARFNELNLSF